VINPTVAPAGLTELLRLQLIVSALLRELIYTSLLRILTVAARVADLAAMVVIQVLLGLGLSQLVLSPVVTMAISLGAPSTSYQTVITTLLANTSLALLFLLTQPLRATLLVTPTPRTRSHTPATSERLLNPTESPVPSLLFRPRL